MSDILKRIGETKKNFVTATGKEPNTIYMNIADYRELCSMAPSGHPDSSGMNEVRGMRIIKRAGAMECVFDESFIEIKPIDGYPERESEYENTNPSGRCVHGNHIGACGKCDADGIIQKADFLEMMKNQCADALASDAITPEIIRKFNQFVKDKHDAEALSVCEHGIIRDDCQKCREKDIYALMYALEWALGFIEKNCADTLLNKHTDGSQRFKIVPNTDYAYYLRVKSTLENAKRTKNQ